MRLSSTLLALAAILAMTGTAQASDTAQGTANATVIAPIAIEAGPAMNFGTVVPPGSGSGTVSSNGGPPTGGAQQLGSFNDQDFTVTGDSTLTYNATGSDPLVTLNNGPETLTASLTYSSLNSFNLPSGTDTLSARGVLTVPSTAVAGTYTGNYNVVVNYN